MKRESLVSIIIPAYNAERYIKRALESAINQTYKNIEIIVVDDGSIDETGNIVKSFHDPRIMYVYQENQWLGAARNNGIRRSKGEYITLLDADDVYLPEKIEKQVEFLQNHPEYKVVYCNFMSFYSEKPSELIKKKGKHPSGDIFKELLEDPLINPNTIMVHRDVFKEVGLFNEKRYNPEDWDMWLRISLKGFEFGYLDEDLVIVEIRRDSLTTIYNQPIYKKNALEMLEKLFSKLTKKEKNFYQTEKILRSMKFKLAFFYLINKKKKEFFETFISLYRYPLKIFTYLIGVIVMLIPPAFLNSILIKFWKINQTNKYLVVDKTYDIQKSK